MKQHKHYQAIRAHADGWGIAYSNKFKGDTALMSNPSFRNDMPHAIIPDADGWLPWYPQDGCSPDISGLVEIRAGGELYKSDAGQFDWNITSLVKFYRPYVEVKPEPKTVKLYRWLMKDDAFFWISLHTDDDLSFDSRYVRRLDETMIEVEV